MEGGEHVFFSFISYEWATLTEKATEDIVMSLVRASAEEKKTLSHIDLEIREIKVETEILQNMNHCSQAVVLLTDATISTSDTAVQNIVRVTGSVLTMR